MNPSLQQRKIQKLSRLVDMGNIAILEYLLELESKIDAEIPNIKDVISIVKGEKGDTPTKEELMALIEPLIPIIEQPRDGIDGKDYILTEYDKKEIAKSIKVPIVEKVIERFTEVVKEPVITRTETTIENPYVLTGENVVNSINELPTDPDLQIDAKHIKNLPKAVNNIMAGGTNGIIEIIAGSNITVDKSNPKYPVVSGSAGGVTSIIAGTNVTISPSSGLGDVTINATGGGSFSLASPLTGNVDSSNTAFTFASKPTLIVNDGITLRENKGWTWSAPTATMDNPPAFDLFAIL